MLFNDLFLDIAMQIDAVGTGDIIRILNNFIMENKVHKEIVFKPVTTSNQHQNNNDSYFLTAINSDGYLVSRYDYEHPVVTFSVKLYDNDRKFPLPQSVVYISSIIYNNSELYNVARGTNSPIPSCKIGLNRQVSFSFPILPDDDIRAQGIIIFPNLPLTITPSQELPFPDYYYSAIRNYVLANLYLNKNYLDKDLYPIFYRNYLAEKSKLNTPSSTILEPIFSL